jgi:hypothetical protein
MLQPARDMAEMAANKVVRTRTMGFTDESYFLILAQFQAALLCGA